MPTRTITPFPAFRQWSMCSFFLAASIAAAYYMRLSPASLATNVKFERIMESNVYVFEESGVVLRRTYTGIGSIDMGLSFLVAAFLPGAAGWNKSFQLLQGYFLFSFFPVLAVWSVEAGRIRNAWKVISFTTLWAIPYQTVGGAIAIPLWFLSFVLTTSKAAYWEKSPSLPLPRAKALLPALVIGYLIPTILVYWPFEDIRTTQAMVALWQPSPFIVNILWFIFSLFSGSEKKGAAQNDLPYVKLVYVITFVVSAAVHIGSLVLCMNSANPEFTLESVFVPVSQNAWSFSGALLYIFQYDCYIILAAALVASYLAAWDMRKIRATTTGTSQAFILITLCALVLGPGAALSATWYWRETRMATQAWKTKRI